MKIEGNDLGVVVVNWNGWADTLECLESLFKLEGFSGPVVVVDNGSTDSSLERILQWAAGNLCVVPQVSAQEIISLVVPQAEKPVSVERLDNEMRIFEERVDGNARLILVASKRNLGFAGGNNVGLRILEANGCDWFWLVNNDTVVAKSAFVALSSALSGREGPVISGNSLVHYFSPDRIQALGGRFSRLWCLTSHVAEGIHVSALDSLPLTVPVDYPVGAGMLVNREYIRRFGLLCEDYFLYFEEIDWVLRAGSTQVACIVPRSIIYHKGGVSTKNAGVPESRSLTADYYLIRNRLLLARKISVVSTILSHVLALGALVRRVTRPQPSLVKNAWRAYLDGLFGRHGRRRQ